LSSTYNEVDECLNVVGERSLMSEYMIGLMLQMWVLLNPTHVVEKRDATDHGFFKCINDKCDSMCLLNVMRQTRISRPLAMVVRRIESR